MMDYTIEDVLNCCDLLIDDGIYGKQLDDLNVYNDCLETLITTAKDLKDCKDELEKKTNQDKEWFSMFNANLNKIQNGLRNVEDELQTLKSTEAEKLREYEKLCRKIASLKEMTSEKTKIFTTVSKDVQNKQDTILTYRLLTGTTFLYNTKNVEGMVSKPSTTVPFSFDHTKISAKDISKQLWKLVLEDEDDD